MNPRRTQDIKRHDAERAHDREAIAIAGVAVGPLDDHTRRRDRRRPSFRHPRVPHPARVESWDRAVCFDGLRHPDHDPVRIAGLAEDDPVVGTELGHNAILAVFGGRDLNVLPSRHPRNDCGRPPSFSAVDRTADSGRA
jgi:hypothetical protein